MRTFGERLRELRLKSGLSQEEAAAQLGVSPQSVSKWETDKCYPEFSLILPLARLYGVSADELLGNEDRRVYWEEQWQEALRQGGEAATLPVTEAALKELPGDRQFRYRQGCTEHIMAFCAETEEEKLRLLTAAEKHLAALHADCPEYDAAAEMLVDVLMVLGRRREAEELCRKIPSSNGERMLQSVLQGEEQRQLRRIVLSKDFFFLLNGLVAYGTPEALEAAERIVTEVLGAEGFYPDILFRVRSIRSKEQLERGKKEKAMAEFLALRDLAARWAGAGGYDKVPEKAPFLVPHVPVTHEEHLWVGLLARLRSPLLAPLRDREEFRALLAEAEAKARADPEAAKVLLSIREEPEAGETG